MKSNILKYLLAVVAMIIGVFSSVCKAETFEVTLPGAEKMTLVAHSNKVPSWLREPSLNFGVIGDVSPQQLAIAAEAERACRIYTKTVQTTSGEQMSIFETCAQEIFNMQEATKGKVAVLRESSF